MSKVNNPFTAGDRVTLAKHADCGVGTIVGQTVSGYPIVEWDNSNPAATKVIAPYDPVKLAPAPDIVEAYYNVYDLYRTEAMLVRQGSLDEALKHRSPCSHGTIKCTLTDGKLTAVELVKES